MIADCHRRHLRRAAGLTAAMAASLILLAACGDAAPTPSAGSARATTSGPRATAVSTSGAPSTTPASTTISSTSTPVRTATTTTEPIPATTIDPLLVQRGFIFAEGTNTSFTPEAHSNYRATDIFAGSCGTPVLSPVDGIVDQILPDRYDRAEDDPALRGGNAVAIVGDDGVRYYLAHFESFAPDLTVGDRVVVGQPLGAMGTTGRSSACHVHFGLSLPCPDTADDWWVRRGVIWPDRYLDAWKAGDNLSPLEELHAWFAEYPDACRSVDDTPYPRA